VAYAFYSRTRCLYDNINIIVNRYSSIIDNRLKSLALQNVTGRQKHCDSLFCLHANIQILSLQKLQHNLCMENLNYGNWNSRRNRGESKKTKTRYSTSFVLVCDSFNIFIVVSGCVWFLVCLVPFLNSVVFYYFVPQEFKANRRKNPRGRTLRTP
jgi:hypothetical protein